MGSGGCAQAAGSPTQLFDHHFVEFTYPDGTKMYNQFRHV